MSAGAKFGSRWTLLMLCLMGSVSDAADPGMLPVFVADNHADSLAFLAERLDLEEPHVLVLVDAHSDATAASRSDELRRGLRRVISGEERRARVDSWRQSGRLQAYNWIEPLMPRPLERVVWIAAPKLHELEKRRLATEARESLDGRMEFEARASGSLAARWTVTDSSGMGRLFPLPIPVVLSLDLDYFTLLPEHEAAQEMELIWAEALRWPLLRAVTVAISRPWQKDDAQAARLLSEFLKLAGDSRGARLSIEHRTRVGEPDDSLRARELAERGLPVPRWQWKDTPALVAARLALMDGRIDVWSEDAEWAELKKQWRHALTSARLEVESAQQGLDGAWRLDKSGLGDAVARVKGQVETADGAVRWWRLEPRAVSYHLLPGNDLGKGFSGETSPWVAERRVFLCETFDAALAPGRWRQALEAGGGTGRLRLAAEIETGAGWMPLPVLELRVSEGRGFHAALSEQVGMPYVFGIGLAADGKMTGAETGWGNDCANFLVQAWRRQGWSLPWCSPGQLRPFLEVVHERVPAGRLGPVALPAGAAEQGVVIDLGEHMAALWEDREPLGMLNREDLIIHHLGGIPAVLPFGDLLATYPHAAILRRPASAPFLAFGGDVVLAHVSEAEVSLAFAEKPPASAWIVNLEGIPSLLDPPTGYQPRFDFRFDPERLRWLAGQGVTAVCLANNHALDAGRDGLREGLAALSAVGLQVFGAGETLEAALTPARLERESQSVSLFGAVCLPWMMAADDQPGVCVLPEHGALLAKAMRREKASGRTVIVMAHWGEEYQSQTSGEQRRWARWLVENGAGAVIGCHPHVAQAADALHGLPVWFSLGNLVFPKHLNRLGSHRWAVWPP